MVRLTQLLFAFVALLFLFGCTAHVPLDDASATASGIQELVVANNKFGLDLYDKLVENDDGNVFFSPYSISTALAMTYEGARGQTAQEMQSVFYFPTESSVRQPNAAAIYNSINAPDAEYALSTANALWAQQDYQFIDEYLNTVERYYGGSAKSVDFKTKTEEARQTINEWVSERTNDKIPELFESGSLNPLSRLVLTNAVYFKGSWETEFDPDLTGDEEFFVDDDTTVQAPMMRQTGREAEFAYAETDDVQVLELPYKGDDLSMILLLPKNNMSALEESLTIENIELWKTQLLDQRVDVYIPKFTFKTSYGLKDTLRDMGMEIAFTENADFSGMDGTDQLLIQAIVHKAFVEVNEEGTEAAAATGVIVGTTSIPVQIPEFRADHPFLFFIQQKETGNMLFMGKVVDPTK
ncbi:serpin family protein [Candidatus Woesearchaeota archaeon]|nr:serpin family protein [Candidatus Woesearchaeota archaeon]